MKKGRLRGPSKAVDPPLKAGRLCRSESKAPLNKLSMGARSMRFRAVFCDQFTRPFRRQHSRALRLRVHRPALLNRETDLMTTTLEKEELAGAILRLHGAHAKHAESMPVCEIFQGQVVWNGVVEVYDLTGHPTAKRAYAWAHEADSGGRRIVAVLHAPPIDSPLKAVQAAIVQEHRSRSSAEH